MHRADAPDILRHQDIFEHLLREWHRADTAVVRTWGYQLRRCRTHEVELRERGVWPAARPTDLMTILGIHKNEVLHCRLLQWIFDPQEAHWLGDRLLKRLLTQINPAYESIQNSRAAVCIEELRTDAEGKRTRADMVIYTQQMTVVIEAKIAAQEQRSQADRLHDNWRNAQYVFLTRDGRTPITAKRSAENWHLLSWRTIVGWVVDEMNTSSLTATGRRALEEWLQTAKEVFGMGDRYFKDEQIKFYLEHRDLIEQWAALRKRAEKETREWLTSLKPRITENELARMGFEPAPYRVETDPKVDLRHKLISEHWGDQLFVALDFDQNPYVDGYTADLAPSIGIWIRESEDQEWNTALTNLIQGTFTSRDGWEHDEERWPAYRYLPPRSDWYENPDAEFERLMRDLKDLWTRSVEVLDSDEGRQLLGATPQSPPSW